MTFSLYLCKNKNKNSILGVFVYIYYKNKKKNSILGVFVYILYKNKKKIAFLGLKYMINDRIQCFFSIFNHFDEFISILNEK